MDPPVKVIDGKLICLKQNHKDPVEMVIIDDQVPLYERLLCLKCFKASRQVSKYISLEEAQKFIEEKLYKQSQKQQEEKKRILLNLNDFQTKMMNTRSKVVQQIDEILRITQQWTTDIKNNNGTKPNINNFIEDLRLIQQQEIVDSDQLINQSYFSKIDNIIQKLMTLFDYQNYSDIIQNIFLSKNDQQKKTKFNQINVQLISTVKQEESLNCLAFNNSGSIMVSGFDGDIIVWNFEKGNMVKKKKLEAFEEVVVCLIFSKKHNWFASGSGDCTIKCWKEVDNENWVSTQPGKFHSDYVYCLVLNNQEDELISGSQDNTIKVWKVNCQVNQLRFDYTLEEKHTKTIYALSLNNQGNALVSSGGDQKIILWNKGQNNRWQYKQELTMDDIGYRICFISDNQIIWQQSKKGITHQIEYNQGMLRKRPDLNIYLNNENDDEDVFPTIYNKKRQVIIQKHNRYVYILKQRANGQLQVLSEPIDCGSKMNYGSLTEDGEYLAIWTENEEFKVYKITYE